MKSAKPPRLAAWILQHFGPQFNSDALAGDYGRPPARAIEGVVLATGCGGHPVAHASFCVADFSNCRLVFTSPGLRHNPSLVEPAA